MSIVAIGLQEPYAKTDVGESCTCVGVFYSRLQVLVASSQDQNTWNTIPGSEYRKMTEQYFLGLKVD